MPHISVHLYDRWPWTVPEERKERKGSDEGGDRDSEHRFALQKCQTVRDVKVQVAMRLQRLFPEVMVFQANSISPADELTDDACKPPNAIDVTVNKKPRNDTNALFQAFTVDTDWRCVFKEHALVLDEKGLDRGKKLMASVGHEWEAQGRALGLALHDCILEMDEKTDLKRHKRVIRLLIAADANVAVTAAFGHTPLHSAIEKACPTIARILLTECGADPNTRSVTGMRPLALVRTIGGNEELEKLLIEYGAHDEKEYPPADDEDIGMEDCEEILKELLTMTESRHRWVRTLKAECTGYRRDHNRWNRGIVKPGLELTKEIDYLVL